MITLATWAQARRWRQSLAGSAALLLLPLHAAQVGRSAGPASLQAREDAAQADRVANEVLRRAQSLLTAEKYDEALAALDEAIRLRPTDDRAYDVRLRARKKRRDWTGVIEDCNQQIMIGRIAGAPYVQRALAYRELGDHQRAMADLEQARLLAPASFEIIKECLITRKELKDYRGSLADLDLLEQQNPGDHHLRSNRGIVRLEMGDLDGALNDFAAALTGGADDARMYFLHGLTLRKKGLLQAAYADYSKAIARQPDFVDAYLDRSSITAEKRDFTGVVAELDALLRVVPDSAGALLNRSRALRCLGRYDEAIADCDRALALESEYRHLLYLSKAQAEHWRGQPAAAAEDFERGLTAKPRWYFTVFYRGNFRIAQGDYIGALADYEHALELKGEDESLPPYIRLYRALLLQRMGRGSARDHFALEVGPIKDPWMLALERYVKGEIDEKALLAAVGEGDKLEQPGRQCDASYVIGLISLMRGDMKKAKAAWETATATGESERVSFDLAKAELAKPASVGETVPAAQKK